MVQLFPPFLPEKHESKNYIALCFRYALPQQVLDEMEKIKDADVIGVTESRRDEFRREQTCVFFKKK